MPTEGSRISSTTAELLFDIQASGKYLFHGSDIISDKLFPSPSTNHGRKDLESRVFATELPEIAVFHALARTVKRTIPDLKHAKHGFSVDSGKTILRAEPKLLTEIRRLRQPTNIYVLDKAMFVRKSEMEWQARKPTSPLGVIFVSGQSLTKLLHSRIIVVTIQ